MRFGPFELDPAAGVLRRSGVPTRLSPQPLKLLTLLTTRAGDLVTREEIRERLWGTGTFVDFEQGVNHCIRSIRAVLEAGPQNGVYIETVPRRGYRFVAPVEMAGPVPLVPANGTQAPFRDIAPPAEPSAPTLWSRLGRRLQLWLRWPRLGPPGGATGVRLAVLPFDCLTNDAERASLCGLADHISTHLARASIERLNLVPSCSAKALKQTSHPVAAARQTGVHFLLGGSVWSSADRALVNAHLVRVHDEKQLWIESYERVLRDVFEFHCEVARAIAAEARTRLPS